MTTTTHLGMTHLQAGSAAAEITVNEALDAIDAHLARFAPDSLLALRIVEHFTGGALSNGAPFSLSSSGTGSGYDGTVASEAGHPGIGQLSTGTTTTGYAFMASKSGALCVFGSDAWTFRCAFKLPVVSDGTDTYTFIAGFGDTPTAAAQTDGAFIRYTHGTNSGKFQCVTESNTTETATDSGVTVAADTWYRLDISVNLAGTSVTFTLKTASGDPVLVATNTTNIPTTSARATGILLGLIKSAGTTARTVLVDLMDAGCVLGASL